MKRSLLARIKEFLFTPLQALPQFGVSRIPRTNFNYSADVGDGLGSSVLMAPVQFIQRSFPEAQLEITQNNNGKPEAVADHAMPLKIARPNGYYTGSALWAGTLFSLLAPGGGNGYWLKIRNSKLNAPWMTNVTGEVQELWYAPHWQMQPQWPHDGSVFISHYQYTVNGHRYDVARENVVHFRLGLDPRNPRLGLSPIESAIREIFSDDEAANMMATLCRNMGVPGLIVSPDGDATAGLEDVDAIKEMLRDTTTGDKRGEPLVFRTATKVDQFGFDPKSMDVSAVRNTAEERVCAALGIPAGVVGFATDQTRVGATMSELRRQAWEGGLVPLQSQMAEQLALSLLPDFESKPERFGVRFSTANVAAMQTNQGDLVKWVDTGIRGGWLRVDHGQAHAGFTPDSTQAVYLRNAYTIEIPAESTKRPAAPGQSRNEPNVGASASPKALKPGHTKAVNRFIRVQAQLEKQMIAKLQSLFDQERDAVIHAAAKQSHANPMANGTWIQTTLEDNAGDWTALFTDTLMDSMRAGWKLLGSDLGRNYGKARKPIEKKDPVATDSPINEPTLGIAFDIFEPRALIYARAQAGLKIAGITETTVTELQSLVEQALQEGWSIGQLTDEITALYDGFSTIRAETIARTETASAINYGKYQAALETQTELGLQLQKTWAAVEDGRTRLTHTIADGQTVKLEEFYLVGGFKMLHPHDPNAPASEIINCRCNDIYSEIPA